MECKFARLHEQATTTVSGASGSVLASLLNRHLAHRLACHNDASRRLFGTRGGPPRLPPRNLSIGLLPRYSRGCRPGCHADQCRCASPSGGRGDERCPALPAPALFNSRAQSQQNRPGRLFHIGHGRCLHLQRGVDQQAVRAFATAVSTAVMTATEPPIAIAGSECLPEHAGRATRQGCAGPARFALRAFHRSPIGAICQGRTATRRF
jgi:hypothetical protein